MARKAMKGRKRAASAASIAAEDKVKAREDGNRTIGARTESDDWYWDSI